MKTRKINTTVLAVREQKTNAQQLSRIAAAKGINRNQALKQAVRAYLELNGSLIEKDSEAA